MSSIFGLEREREKGSISVTSNYIVCLLFALVYFYVFVKNFVPLKRYLKHIEKPNVNQQTSSSVLSGYLLNDVMDRLISIFDLGKQSQFYNNQIG